MSKPKTESAYVDGGLWHIELEGAKPDTGEPLFVAGNTLAEMEAVFEQWNDMGYKIKRVTRVGRVVAWKTWKITGGLE